MAPPMPVMMSMRMEAAQAPPPTPTVPGEVKTSASVTVVFELR
jgi:uncharacterized protein YggE